MSAKVSKHGQVLATMKIDKLQSAYGSKKKRNALIRKELTRRGVSIES